MPFILHRLVGRRRVIDRVAGASLRIGRGAGADLRLDAVAVALEHAVLSRVGDGERKERGGWRIVDKGSVTGTYVNGTVVAPGEGVELAEGDVIEIGGSRILVKAGGPDDTLTIEIGGEFGGISEADRIRPAAGVAQPEALSIDYVGSYRLRRGVVSKLAFTALLAALALLAVAGLLIAGRTSAFRPGEFSRAHAGEIAADACGECHRPFRGAVDPRCIDCHTGPEHQTRQAFTPACSECHFEHRGLDRLTLVDDAGCTVCHGSLTLAQGGRSAFAAEVLDFGRSHPQFALTVSGRRIPVDQAAARTADPGRLRLNHKLHLEAGLLGPRGRVQLVCGSCHLPAADGLVMEPVSYETHCADCHRLSFDERLPDEMPPHGDPETVRNHLLGVYSRLFAEGPRSSLSFRQRRGARFRTPGVLGSEINLERAVANAVNEAEVHLYRTACEKCHFVDLDTVSLPDVEAVAIPARWLPHARFPHSEHKVGVECADCHGGAAASVGTADVLLPGIEACRRCHGSRGGSAPGTSAGPTTGSGAGEGRAAEAQVEKVPSACVDCHRYHSRIGSPAAVALIQDLPTAGSNSIGGASP